MDYTNHGGVNRVTSTSGDPASYADARRAQDQERDAGRFVPTVNNDSGVRSLVIGGAAQTTGAASYQHDSNPSSAGDVLATARTATGGPVTRELRETDTVAIGGQRMSLAVAVTIGALVRDGSGYRQPGARVASETPAAPQQEQNWQLDRQPNDQQQEQQPEAHEPLADLPAEAHEAMTEFNEKVGNIDHQRITRAMIEQGSITEEMARTAATQMNMEPEAITERAERVRQEFTTQANQMAGEGADVIFDWAREAAPALLKEAVKAHVYDANPAAYSGVVTAFWKDLARNNPQAILEMRNAQEVGARLDRNGVLTVEVPGAGRMSLVAAINAGMTSIGKKAR